MRTDWIVPIALALVFLAAGSSAKEPTEWQKGEVINVIPSCPGAFETGALIDGECECELGYVRYGGECVDPTDLWLDWNVWDWGGEGGFGEPPPGNPDGKGSPDPECTDETLEKRAAYIESCGQLYLAHAQQCEVAAPAILCADDIWPTGPADCNSFFRPEPPHFWLSCWVYGGKGMVLGDAEGVRQLCLAEWATEPPKEAKAQCMAPVEDELDACLDKTAELFPECEPEQPPVPGPSGWQQQPIGVGAMR